MFLFPLVLQTGGDAPDVGKGKGSAATVKSGTEVSLLPQRSDAITKQ